MRVCIAPRYQGADQADGGIRRVIEAQERYLADYDVTITDNAADADLIACHGATLLEFPATPMVCHSHGLMWSDYAFGEWGDKINQHVIDVLIRANAVTAPSKWVSHAISRGMLVKPEVIYHGVDADEWAHSLESLNYVLWNKARVDPVSDPREMNAVAEMLPGVPFMSTFGVEAPNVMTFGAVPYQDMRIIVQQAGVYLATARETFGIGTLEALAAGVPIAGWRYGGQAEIVIEGETGYLAPYGDYVALAECIDRCLQERARLSANCIDDAKTRWAWPDKIAQYAALYHRVAASYYAKRPKVSVVLTCYNLAQYLPDALNSVVSQTLDDYECLIVDDCSTDDTAGIAKQYAKKYSQCKYLKTPHNLKLSGARNYGWQHSKGRYIVFLDADDMLEKNAIDQLSMALDQRSDLHIVYGRLDTIAHDGSNRQRNSFPSGDYSWHGQLAHLNQLPYASMMRREVMERSGGYRVRDWRAEDAAMWCRLTSFGFRAACVTEDTTLIYRMRGDSKSKGEDGDGDWTAWYPWRLAGSAQEGLAVIDRKAQPNIALVPFGAQGKPPQQRKAWPVKHHQDPAVSIIIPVGPGHARYLVDALDSVQAQTIVDWECIVVNDTGEPIDLSAWPWVQLVETSNYNPLTGTTWEPGGKGAGATRNAGLRSARAPLVTFLDADDILTPRALEVMLDAYTNGEGRYIYSDWLSLGADGQWDGPYDVHQSQEYDGQLWLRGMQHPVTILIATEDARKIGGFDEQLPAWEDWDFMIKCATAGIEGRRVAEPLLIYRLHTGQRRQASKQTEEQLYAAITDRYQGYISGELPMGTCCGGNASALGAANNALAAIMPEFFGEPESPAPPPVQPAFTRMEYVGDEQGAQTWIGPSGKQYRAGREQSSRFIDVHDPRDVERFVALGKFVVRPPVMNAAV